MAYWNFCVGEVYFEISKWMRGTHNFTIGTIAAIEAAFCEPILRVYDGEHSLRN